MAKDVACFRLKLFISYIFSWSARLTALIEISLFSLFQIKSMNVLISGMCYYAKSVVELAKKKMQFCGSACTKKKKHDGFSIYF